MKKIKLLLLLFISVSFFACKDESGEFSSPMLSNAEMVQGLKECLNISLDTANAHLSVHNGFYQYKDSAYRIHFPASVKKIVDTLTAHGYGKELIDSLIVLSNRIAEANGSVYKMQISSLISKTSFPDPKSIINSTHNAAASEYFKSVQLLPMIDVLKPIVAENMRTFYVVGYWQAILTLYATYDSTPIWQTLDFSYEVTRQIAENIIAEMAIEEGLIRQYENHRKTNLLKKIFE
jgi:hypothetical protein